MTAIPTMTATDTEFHMAVPYPLNRAFRAIFKTAKWNPGRRVFVAAATPQNRNKWEQFLVSVEEAVTALGNAHLVEATTEELESAAREAERAVESAMALTREFEQRANAARERRIRAEAQLVELAPIQEKASAALDDVLEASAAVEEARNLAIAPAVALYERRGLGRVLANFTQSARRGHSGKEACSRAKDEIIALRNDLKSIGFRLPAIDDLASVSLNRPDKIAQFVESVHLTLQTGLEVIEMAK